MTNQTLSKPESLILAIDPGKHTGWALFSGAKLQDQGVIVGGVDGFIGWWCENIDAFIDLVDVFVVEDYISDGTTTGRVWSSEIIGAVKMAASDSQIVTLQQRGAKTGLIGQEHKGDKGEKERFDWLASKGFVSPSKEKHDLDAITHALVYLKKIRHREAYYRYWA